MSNDNQVLGFNGKFYATSKIDSGDSYTINNNVVLNSNSLGPNIVNSNIQSLGQILNIGQRVSEIKVLFEPSKNKTDEKLVRYLMKRYVAQCKL